MFVRKCPASSCVIGARQTVAKSTDFLASFHESHIHPDIATNVLTKSSLNTKQKGLFKSATQFRSDCLNKMRLLRSMLF